MRYGIHSYGCAGACRFRFGRHGFTVVELIVTIVIVAVLAATVGVFFSRLLTIQERDREEAYIREKLADICGAYADAMSVGASFGTRTNHLNHSMDLKVNYRHETGGVSLETGNVTRVAQMLSSIDSTNKTVVLGVYGFMNGGLARKLLRRASGDAPLIPLAGNMVSCTIRPLYGNAPVVDVDGYRTNNAALGYLEVKAEYQVKNDEGKTVWTNATAERVVRLWNRE